MQAKPGGCYRVYDKTCCQNTQHKKSGVTRTGLIVSRPASIVRVLRYRARFERKVYHNSQLQPCLRP